MALKWHWEKRKTIEYCLCTVHRTVTTVSHNSIQIHVLHFTLPDDKTGRFMTKTEGTRRLRRSMLALKARELMEPKLMLPNQIMKDNIVRQAKPKRKDRAQVLFQMS